MIYLIPAGGVLYVNGIELAKSIEDETHRGVGADNYWILTEFIGAAIAVLFYVSSYYHDCVCVLM